MHARARACRALCKSYVPGGQYGRRASPLSGPDAYAQENGSGTLQMHDADVMDEAARPRPAASLVTE